jgi:hypothetical protein
MPVPAQVTVFGILHLILAALGLLGVVASRFMQDLSRTMTEAQAGAPGIAGAQARLQAEMLTASQGPTFFYLGGSALLAVLLVVSGVLLLKRRPAGIKVSNAYAWTSIALKLGAIVLFFGWTMPRLEPMFAEVAREAGAEAAFLGSFMRITMAASGVISPVIMCLYPALALILLNRPKVKAALGAAPATH